MKTPIGLLDNAFSPPAPSRDTSSSTFYIPIAAPPTPAPSPRPFTAYEQNIPINQSTSYEPAHLSRIEFASLTTSSRRQYLVSILNDCSPAELRFVAGVIGPMLKRDFLKELPAEIAFHVLSFVDDPRTLARASQVCRHWHNLISDDWLWKKMCESHQFDTESTTRQNIPLVRPMSIQGPLTLSQLPLDDRNEQHGDPFTYRKYFRTSYTTMSNWRRGGRMLRAHRIPIIAPSNGVITSAALDEDWVVVALTSNNIHVFNARTGVLTRTLTGHDQGVWTVHLVSRGAYREDGDEANTSVYELGHEDLPDDQAEGAPEQARNLSQTARIALGIDHDVPPPCQSPTSMPKNMNDKRGKPSDVCCASEGWGQPSSLVVSGGCDKMLRVWEVTTGHCIYILRGHTSTIRCIKVLHNRPVAVTGSRDSTLRVWDIQRGRMLRVLQGHQNSVRCLDVCGNRVVSGSYDATCRIWNIDTGECLQVLEGHAHQLYSVAFDGARVASGSLDTTVRVWDANTGVCIALLQGHTALVCQLQLYADMLITGGSDGRVVTFSLSTFTSLHRIVAHDSSVTSLQFDQHFLVTGGNDGRVRLYETFTGNYIRDLTDRCESVWKVIHRNGICVIMCKRAGKTVMEIWSFNPRER